MKRTKRITAANAIAYARTTGYSLALALESLRKLTPLLRERVIRAAMTQTDEELHDPIEEEVAIENLLSQAGREALRNLAARGVDQELSGFGHAVWQEKAAILRDRFGIVWFSPADMNQHIMYDSE